MKVYVFLTPSIVGVGGAELYIANKCRHLKSLGYKVLVLSYLRGEVKVPGLQEYQNFVIPELILPFFISSKKVQNKIIKKISDACNDCDELMIESHVHALCFWGEFLASKLNGTNICYLLTETFPILTEYEREFYTFKLNQNLLMGIDKCSIANLMNDGKEYKDTFLVAVGAVAGVITSEMPFDDSKFPQCDFYILSFGRQNKEYIPHMIDAVSKFASVFADKRICLTFIGGYSNDLVKVKKEAALYKNPNLAVYDAGELCPVPEELVKKHDVAIAVAGCAYLCVQQDLPTITVDASDFKAIGILGVTTSNNILRTSEPLIEIETLLKTILIDKQYNSSSISGCKAATDYDTHDQLLQVKSNSYFDLQGVKLEYDLKCKRFLIALLGFSNINRLRNARNHCRVFFKV